MDNTAALMALARGKPDQPDLGILAKMFHVATFSLRFWIYFEWIEARRTGLTGSPAKGLETPGCAGTPLQFKDAHA